MLPTVFYPNMTKARLMEFEESIKWIDDRIFAKTGKRLDSLQISILEATSRGQKYPQIAEEYNFSNDHVRKAAWKLWKLLSDVFGEPVSQSNFRTLVQRGFFPIIIIVIIILSIVIILIFAAIAIIQM